MSLFLCSKAIHVLHFGNNRCWLFSVLHMFRYLKSAFINFPCPYLFKVTHTPLFQSLFTGTMLQSTFVEFFQFAWILLKVWCPNWMYYLRWSIWLMQYKRTCDSRRAAQLWWNVVWSPRTKRVVSQRAKRQWSLESQIGMKRAEMALSSNSQHIYN